MMSGLNGRDKLIFWHADTNSGKPKVTSMVFGWARIKNGHDLLVRRALKFCVF